MGDRVIPIEKNTPVHRLEKEPLAVDDARIERRHVLVTTEDTGEGTKLAVEVVAQVEDLAALGSIEVRYHHCQMGGASGRLPCRKGVGGLDDTVHFRLKNGADRTTILFRRVNDQEHSLGLHADYQGTTGSGKRAFSGPRKVGDWASPAEPSPPGLPSKRRAAISAGIATLSCSSSR